MTLLIRLVVEVRREKRTYGGPSGREVGLSVGFFSSPPLVLKQEGAAAEGLAVPPGAGFLHKDLTRAPPVRVGHHDGVPWRFVRGESDQQRGGVVARAVHLPLS